MKWDALNEKACRRLLMEVDSVWRGVVCFSQVVAVRILTVQMCLKFGVN